MPDVDARVSRLEGLLEFLATDPRNWNLRADVFDAALEAGRFETAQAQVDHAQAFAPEDAAWQHRQAVLYLATKRYVEAQAAFEGLVAQGHREPAILYNLAFALFRQGKVESASQVLEPLIADPSPEASVSWVLWLRCQHRLDRVTPALEALRARLNEHPVPVEALGVASIMAADHEALDEARLWADAALRARPNQLEALATRGTLALVVRQPAEALQWFERALQQNPEDGRCWSGVGLARAMAQDLQGADQAFRKAVATMPEHIGTWIAWGWCQYATDRVEEARRSFEQALLLDRNFGESHGSLAVALARLGRTEEARQEIALALRLDPRGFSAHYAEAILDGSVNDQRTVQVMVNAALRAARPKPSGGAAGASV